MDNLNKNFKPNINWMSLKYDEMNSLLFNGELGDCDFGIFTKGKGSQGGVLGWFKITGSNIRIFRKNRRMFRQSLYWGDDDELIDKNNFVELCKPRIELNGNYNGTEKGFLATLVHEMCHYYNYMYGYSPRQAHGVEFKEIANIVSIRSKGMFTVQRVATAEQMNELELNDEMKARREKRLANKKSSVTAVLVFCKNGNIKLTMTSNKYLINLIYTSEKGCGENVITTNNANVIDFLFSKGYKKNMRTWRWWLIENEPWINELKSMLSHDSTEPSQNVNVSKNKKKIFSINTKNGKFECDGTDKTQLFNTIKQRFPNMSDENIEKIMNNQANYRVMENVKTTKEIIREIIEEFIKNDSDDNMDVIAINPNMNLGEYSPLEL